MKKSFILYKDSYDYLKELSDSEFGFLMKCVFEYVISKKSLDKSHSLYLAFAALKSQLDRDEEKYKNTCETNKINGSKGGKRTQATATKRKRVKANQADNDNDSDNVNEIDNVKEQFELFWVKYPNKVAKQKSQSLFESLGYNDRITILNTIESFASYKPFATYTHPNPTTYLNQRRWEDVIPQQTEVVKPTNQITYDVWHIAKQVPAEMERICKATGLTNEQFLNLYVGK